MGVDRNIGGLGPSGSMTSVERVGLLKRRLEEQSVPSSVVKDLVAQEWIRIGLEIRDALQFKK